MSVIIFTEHWPGIYYDQSPDDFVDAWYRGTTVTAMLEEYIEFVVRIGQTVAEDNMPHLEALTDTIQTIVTYHTVEYPHATQTLDNFLSEYEHFVSAAASYPFWATQKECDELKARQQVLHENYLAILSAADPVARCAGELDECKFQLTRLADDCAEKWQIIADRYEEMAQAIDDFYKKIVCGQCAQAMEYLRDCMDGYDHLL